jgi:Family of unknown function (DUF5995)
MESTEQRSGAVTAGGGGRAASRAWLERSDLPQRPKNVREALRALDAVTERLLGDEDARATFPDVYAIVTRQIAERVDLGAGAYFNDPRWISRLAGRFCERYLDTLRWSLAGSAQDCDAWDIAYAACESGGRLPIQHLMLGISAHINYDLAIGVYRTLAEGTAPDSRALRRYKHDFDRVNDLLQASIPEVFAHLIGRHRCDASRVIFRRAYALSRWAALQIVTSWRERVWDDALAMLDAGTPSVRGRVVQRMERRSRRYARLLSLPVAAVAAVTPPAASPRAGRGLFATLFSQAQPRAVRPASVATTAVSSAGSTGLGRCDEYPASSARLRSWTVA